MKNFICAFTNISVAHRKRKLVYIVTKLFEHGLRLDHWHLGLTWQQISLFVLKLPICVIHPISNFPYFLNKKLINSLWDWSPWDWGNRVETIWKTSMSQKKTDGNFEQNIKTVLSWVVVSRIVISHIYTLTYISNLYSILMWCQRKMLLSWMIISAFKNFILEVIVFIVVILLYIEGNISEFLFGTVIIDKLISLAIAAHNWFTINSFYIKLKEIDQRKLMRMNQRTPLAFNVMIGMSMRHLRLDESDSFHIKKRQRFISVPNLENLTIDSLTEFGDEYKSIRPSKSLNTISLLSVRYLDNGENLFNTDDSSLTISERVLKILGISNNYVENILSRDSRKSNHSYKKFKSSNNQSELKNIMNTDMQSSDVCSSNEKSANIEKNLNDEMNINPTSRDKFIENYSEWSEQWTMNNILNKTELTDDSYSKNVDRTISVKDNYCQWSSDSESCDTLSHCYFASKPKLQEVEESEPKVVSSSDRNLEINKQENVSEKVPKKNYNFIDESVEAIEDDKIIFTTWIRDLIYVEILKKEVGLFEDNSDNIAKRIILKNTGTDSKVLTEVQTQTQTDEKWPGINSNQINFVTVNNINLPEVNGNEYSKYSSDYINLLMKSSGKKSFEITREREDKELKALKAFNEATLWKDKRLKDMERLKKAPIESISLSKNKFEMKNINHTGKETVHKKNGEKSGFQNITKNLNFNLLYNKNNNKDLQTHRKLDRSRATVNIPNLQSLKTDDLKISKLGNKIDILENGTKNALNSKISPASIIKKPTGLLYTDIKSRIANIDWSLFSNNDDSLYKKPTSRKFGYRRTGFDFIDDRDIITLLQSAFSFDPRENDRGFYLGPASTELYSVTNSDQIPNVFNEIIKAARLTIVRHECPYYSSTREIDFGDDYLSDLQTFGENDNQQYYKSTKIPQITEIIHDSDDTAPNLQEKEIYLMDYWFQKYKELALDSNKLSPQKLSELARLPGFYLFKKLISQINCSLMVSISTVVSMESIESDHATTSRTLEEPSNPEISENAESPGNIFDENQIEGQGIDTQISNENICMNGTYQNMRTYEDYCNWSDESRTFLNFTNENSDVSLGNESNMSEFAEDDFN